MENKIPKAAKNLSGIYKITTNQSGKIYIGSAVKLSGRFNRHKFELRHNNHHSKHLQNHVNKNGIESLSFELIELCDRELLLDREQFYLDNLTPEFNNYLNAKSPLGRKMSKESIEKAVATKRANGVYERVALITAEVNRGNTYRLGRKLTDESKAKIGAKSKGRKPTSETREKLRLVNTGRYHSEDTRKKMSLAAMGNKKGLGRIVSKETRDLIQGRLIKRIEITQMSLSGEFIRTWGSIHEASKELKISKANLTTCCNGKRKNCGGYRWKYS